MRIPTAAVARTLAIIGVSACAAGLSCQAIASADPASDIIAQRVEALYQNTTDPSFYTPACWAHAKPMQQRAFTGVPAVISNLEIYVDGNDATVSFIQGVIAVHQHWVLRGGRWVLDC